MLVGTSTKLFHFFKCHEFPVPSSDGGGSQHYLYKDYSVDCNGDRYASFAAFAGCMVLVYPVGIPLLYASLLHRARHTLTSQVRIDGGRTH